MPALFFNYQNLLNRRWMVEGLGVSILSLLITPQTLTAHNISGPSLQIPFNVDEIIERVTHHPIKEGDKIVIKDAVYEAFFDERGVVLKPKRFKKNAEDLVIPINGKPGIKDGKVIYHTGYGDIIFYGTNQGLNFEERYRSSLAQSPDYLITQYTGNVAHLENEKVNECSRTGEFLIDTNVVYVLPLYSEFSPSVAFDGTNYLVVWEDSRRGRFTIYGARVSKSGVVLDSAGIGMPIPPYTNTQGDPSVAFNGTNYLVVWKNYSCFIEIYGARVSPGGVVLDSAGILISPAAYLPGYPSVASDGTNYLVVWEDYLTPIPDIYGARVSPGGVVLDSSGIPISTAAYDQRYPSVAFDGTNYLVVWEDYRSGSHFDIYGARVSQGGAVLDSSGIPISTAARSEHPSVAFNGTNYLVVWEDFRSGSTLDIYGARVASNGTVLDPAGIPISTAENSQMTPSVAFNGTNYLVVWKDYRNWGADIYGARVASNGTVLDPAGIPVSTAVDDQEAPSVASDGTNYLVVWEGFRSGSHFDIYGARVSQGGAVLDSSGIPISTAAYGQWYPSVASDGTNYLVVWEDSRSGTYSDIYGARVATDGTVLDPAGIPISTAGSFQLLPSVASDGTNYLVVWDDFRGGSHYDIYGARVASNGTVLDPAGIPISTAAYGQWYPAVAFNGTNYLVVWEDYGDDEIYGARVSPGGVVLDSAGILISPAAYLPGFPSVASDGTNYLVVWHDYRSGSHFDLYGARVSPGGVVLDSSGIPISIVANHQWYPAVAFDGTNYLVVWEDSRSGTYSEIYGARVSPGGVVLDSSGIPISIVAGPTYPAVAFDGTNYLVVWQDDRAALTLDIYGARVNPSGVVMDSFPVSTQPGDQCSPALAHGPGNQVLITYSGWIDYINGHPANTMRIWGKFYPFIEIEEGVSISKDKSPFIKIEPNPFNSSTRIKYSLARPCAIELRIYNIAGQCVRTLVNANQNAGIYELNWNGNDDNGRKLPQGIYILWIETERFSKTKKIVKIIGRSKH